MTQVLAWFSISMLIYIYKKNTKLLCVDCMDTSLQVLVFHACTSMAISDPGPAYNGLCFQLLSVLTQEGALVFLLLQQGS